MGESSGGTQSPFSRFWRWCVVANKPEPERADKVGSTQLDQLKATHDEISKTIRRVFHTLAGTCLFCIITLAGSPDSKLLTPEATVKLPLLNYDMGFASFLVVGPVLLTVLTMYLHIFVNDHRRYPIPEKLRLPILPNFSSFSAKAAVWLLFYWMTPITLAFFTWKARPVEGELLFTGSMVVAAVLVILQVRRSPKKWRGWAFPLLGFLFCLFVASLWGLMSTRQLNLFKADLSGKDLRHTNLEGAFLAEAILSGTNLTMANLTNAYLREADLRGANLTKADLTGANLTNAYLRGANLTKANLTGALNLSQGRLDQACGDDETKLPGGLTIKPCEPGAKP